VTTFENKENPPPEPTKCANIAGKTPLCPVEFSKSVQDCGCPFTITNKKKLKICEKVTNGPPLLQHARSQCSVISASNQEANHALIYNFFMLIAAKVKVKEAKANKFGREPEIKILQVNQKIIVCGFEYQISIS
jgi:hypothetical protein